MSIRHSVALALIAIVLANLSLTLNDALVKLAQGQMDLWTVFWTRALIAVPILLILAWRSGWLPRSVGMVALRSALLASSWVTLYTAFNYMPISTAVAIAYANPIMIAVLVAVLDRRRLSSRVWVAVGLGFLGALLIVQPKLGGTLWAYALPLSTAATYAIAMVMTNRKLTEEAPATLSLWLNFAFMAVGAAGVLLAGSGLISSASIGLSAMPVHIISMGVIIAFAAIFVAFAFQNAPAPLVGVFDFSYLLCAILWGYLFFHEVPNLMAFTGMITIAIAGALTLFDRSRQRSE